MGLGAPELILITIVIGINICGYQLGKTRTIGGGVGLILTFFLSILGLIIIAFFPKKYDPIFYSPSSKADDLKKFKELYDSGAITEAEYNNQKAKLLS